MAVLVFTSPKFGKMPRLALTQVDGATDVELVIHDVDDLVDALVHVFLGDLVTGNWV